MFKDSRRNNIIVIVVIIVAVTVISLIRGGGITGSWTVGDDSVTFNAGTVYSFTVNYEDIESITLEEIDNYGEKISSDGEAGKKLYYGQFKNDQFGEYYVIAIPTVRTCTVIKTKDGGVYALNYENDSTTASFMDAIKKDVEEKMQITLPDSVS